MPSLSNYPPTTFLNVAIFMFSSSISIFCLWASSRAWEQSNWLMLALAAVIFSFSNNTLFSLLHECVHRAFSKNKQINEFFGTLTAAFFPTGFRLQRRFHMSHHRHNRTDSEMFDMYYIEDKRWLKNLQWYSIFTGVYWMSVPLAALIYLVWPSFYGHKFFQRGHALGDQTGSDEMFLSILQETRPFLTRIEILYSLLFQLSLFAILNYSFIPWLICHWIFGMNWGALQYADHAWSPRDVREGAWNLKVPRLVRWIFLNYHIHHAHHVYPQIPWYHLKKFEDSKMEKSFLDIYLQMWRGPKLTTDRRPKLLTNEEVEEMGVQ